MKRILVALLSLSLFGSSIVAMKRIAQFKPSFIRRGVHSGLNLAPVNFVNQLAQKEKLSQTEHYLVNNNNSTHQDRYLHDYLKDKDLYSCMNAIIDKEKELDDLGYYTFVHGHSRQFYLLLQFYTVLWEKKYGKSAKDYIFPRCIRMPDDSSELSQEIVRRKSLREKASNPVIVRTDPDIMRSNLFMNWGLFANRWNPGSNTAHYIKDSLCDIRSSLFCTYFDDKKIA